MPKFKVCAVYGCTPGKNSPRKMYGFPKVTALRKRWAHLCHRNDPINHCTANICEKHFSPHQKRRCLKYELLGYIPQKYRDLKDDAVPDMNLPFQLKPSLSDALRENRAEQRHEHKRVQQILSGCVPASPATKLHQAIPSAAELHQLPHPAAELHLSAPSVDELDHQGCVTAPPGAELHQAVRHQTVLLDQAILQAAEPRHPVFSVADPHQAPLAASELHHAPLAAADSHQAPFAAADPYQALLAAADPYQTPLAAADPHQTPLAAADPHQAPLPAAELHQSAGLNNVAFPAPETRFSQWSYAELDIASALVNFQSQDINNNYHGIQSCDVNNNSVSTTEITVSSTVNSTYESLNNILTETSKKLKSCQDQLQEAKDALSVCFTDSQVKALMSGQPVTTWEEEDIATALVLRSLSLKTYRFLREQLHIPLPHVSTLDRWIANINIEPGLLNSVIRMMKLGSSLLSKRERVAVCSFDEMKITKNYSYDRAVDKIYAPHDYVQVCMVSGILGDWKQPVYYSFDKKMTKELLFKIVEEVEAAGYEIHATVCDMAGCNQGLLRQLGISNETSHFINPADSFRNIYVFADVPHLLKLVRNNLLDHTILTEYGEVNAAPLHETVQQQSGLFKINPKLSTASLTVKGTQRQKVKTAAQTLSETTSKSLTFLGESGHLKSVNWKSVAKFIQIVDGWFDVMNSSVTKADKYLRSAFRGFESQMEILHSTIDLFLRARINGKMYPYQNGIIISTKSLIGLFEQLKSMHDCKCILTRKLNQDVLENTFGIIRQMGGSHEHPDPVTFKYRMRRFVLSRKHVLVTANPNTTLQKEDRLVTSGIKTFAEVSSPVKKYFPANGDVNANTESYVVDGEFEHEFALAEYEVEDFKYALGYIVKKFGVKYPFLQAEDDSDDWISFKSRGGLKRMASKFVAEFEKIEQEFRNRHHDKLVEGNNAVARMWQCVRSLCSLPEEVVTYFIRCRIFFKIRQLNQSISFLAQQKRCKKMKKIVT